MPVVLGGLVAVVLGLMGASPAVATWSPARTVKVSPYGAVAIAVNGRGDVVIAWAERAIPSGPARPGTRVHVTIAPAGAGTPRTRVVWSSSLEVTGQIAVTIDARDEVTVAWASSIPRRNGGTVRAAFGKWVGDWHAAQVVGRGLAPVSLAVSAQRVVLLTWTAIPPVRGDQAFSTPSVAWRTPGRPFGTPRALRRPRLVLPVQSTPAVPAFDDAGTAYVTSPCDAVVMRTWPGSRRFRAPVLLDAGQVVGFDLAVSYAGRGLASWVQGRCTADVMVADTPGPAFASVLSAGRFGMPRRLSAAASAYDTVAVALPDGSGTVSWGERNDAESNVFTTAFDRAGQPGLVDAPPGAIVPVTATGGGDQLLVPAFPNPPATSALQAAVRPAGGGPDQSAPHLPSLFVADHIGRAIAIAWGQDNGNLMISVWQPGMS